jgi:hypothetical protein
MHTAGAHASSPKCGEAKYNSHCQTHGQQPGWRRETGGRLLQDVVVDNPGDLGTISRPVEQWEGPHVVSKQQLY